MAKKDIGTGISPDLRSLAEVKRNNRTSGGRVIPLQGNAEVYMKEDGTMVLRKKTSAVPSLPQQGALRKCANKLKEADDEDINSRSDVYEFMDNCMADEGFEGEE